MKGIILSGCKYIIVKQLSWLKFLSENTTLFFTIIVVLCCTVIQTSKRPMGHFVHQTKIVCCMYNLKCICIQNTMQWHLNLSWQKILQLFQNQLLLSHQLSKLWPVFGWIFLSIFSYVKLERRFPSNVCYLWHQGIKSTLYKYGMLTYFMIA